SCAGLRNDQRRQIARLSTPSSPTSRSSAETTPDSSSGTRTAPSRSTRSRTSAMRRRGTSVGSGRLMPPTPSRWARAIGQRSPKPSVTRRPVGVGGGEMSRSEPAAAGAGPESAADVKAAYRADTARILRQRLNLTVALFVALVGVSVVLEGAYHPDRQRTATLVYLAEVIA